MAAELRRAAPDADDRTVLQPRRAAPARPRAAGSELQRLVAGVNPLLGASSVLLALVAQLRATTTHADPDELHRQLLTRLREFEADARAAGVPALKIGAARYLLCTFLDEVVAGTPWGASARSLLEEFHDERSGGEKAFKLLEKLGEDVAGNRDLLELFYVCISLGFEGRFRDGGNGRAQLDAIAQRLFETVRRPEDATRTLSLQWKGVADPRRKVLSVLPLWAVFTVAAALIIGALLAFGVGLSERSDPVFRQILGVPGQLAAERFAAAAARPRLATRLQSDIASGALTVRDEPMRSIVSIGSDALFEPGSARVEDGDRALLGRVAKALAELPGQVVVSGHTDSAASPSLQFPTNWHLSRARALAVADVLAAQGVVASRLRGEGRADVEPVSSGTSDAERARNRRIEIALLLPRPDN